MDLEIPNIDKIPIKNENRIKMLHDMLPTLKKHMEKTTVTGLQDLTFISSRTLTEIIKFANQIKDIYNTANKIELYMKDTVDDEVKNIAIAASKKTAIKILHKLGYGNSKAQEFSTEDLICESSSESENCNSRKKNNTDSLSKSFSSESSEEDV